MSDLKKKLDKGIAYLKRNGMRETIYRAGRKVMLARPVRYENWLIFHTASEKELRKQREAQMWKQTKVCVWLFPGEEEEKQKTMESLKHQTCGKLAVYEGNNQVPEKAEYVLLVQPGVLFRPEAVYEMVQAAVGTKKELLYTDHDVKDAHGHLKDPFCKPEFDPVWQEQINYLGAALLVSKDLIEKLDETNWVQIWKQTVREAEQVVHIPRLLYHVTESLQRRTEQPKDWYQKRELGDFPLLSVIIPNKDHGEDLKQCVDSVRTLGGYENLEILIVENNSTEEDTFQIYEQLQKMDDRIHVITWKKEFNYSAINNEAARQARGAYLLFLNNDTKVKEPGAIKELMRCAVTEKAGAAGCRLVYGDHTIQHAGVVLGYGGIAGHAFEGMPQEEYEKQRYSRYIRQMSAVTAACMVVNRTAFEVTGGFTEELGVAYNDIDFCMKLRKAGWMVLYDPLAQFYHYESQTRGFEMTAQKAERVKKEAEYFCRIWKKELERGDRFYNPNLTLEKADFSLTR